MSEGYPKVTVEARKGEIGVQLVSRIVNEDFGWLFKRNHQEHDFGIDGYIEVVTENGYVTGQMLAVQIKFGASFFKSSNKWGYIYFGESKHLNYLSNCPMPVIIIICNPESRECLWCLFEETQTMPSGQHWKITIPFENNLAQSKQRLMDIIGTPRNIKHELERHWSVTNHVLNSNFIVYFVDKSEIDLLDVRLARRFFDRLRATKEIADHCKGKIELCFGGYDNDERELFEIPEVRKYIILLDQVLPELFFFLGTSSHYHALTLFFISLHKFNFPNGRAKIGEKHKVQITKDDEITSSFLERHFIGLNEMTAWLGLSEEENRRITRSVVKRLFPDLPSNL